MRETATTAELRRDLVAVSILLVTVALGAFVLATLLH
jgi:hypothetical protein